MQADRLRKLDTLFQAAIDLPVSERKLYLDEMCTGDPVLRADVQSLLRCHEAIAIPLDEIAAVRYALLADEHTRLMNIAGQTLGPYRVLHLLGTGGMSQVWLAEDIRLGRKVALKFLPANRSKDSDMAARLINEAQAASALNHPNIVTIYEVGDHAGTPYIASEHIEGQTLRQRLLKGVLPINEAIAIMGQVADGISAAHRAGLVHRDIKPENIMLRPDGRAKVLDFGIAKWLNDRSALRSTQFEVTQTNGLLGTIAYLSPEQAQGLPVDYRSDIWNLGIVFYEMLTGIRPFGGCCSEEILANILSEPPVPPSRLNSSIPVLLDTVINKAIEKSPETRYQNVFELQDALTHVIRNRDKARANQVRLVLGGMGLLALLALVLLFLPSPHSVPRVTTPTQLTNDGKSRVGLVADNSFVYCMEGTSYSNFHLVKMPVQGGDSIALTGELAHMLPLDVSASRSELLLADLKEVLSGRVDSEPHPLFVAPSSGLVAPQRVGELRADEAQWSPDGTQIIFSVGRQLQVAQRDGLKRRALLTLPSHPVGLRWSPDGQRIRFTLQETGKVLFHIWEVGKDGRGLHALFTKWSGHAIEASGTWTPDGAFYLFLGGWSPELWAVAEHAGRLRWGAQEPVKLSSGSLMTYSSPTPSPDGKRIFVYGDTHRAELVSYDRNSSSWRPYLSGISATQTDFSLDKRAVTYTSYPDNNLWRMDLDGTRRLQLTRGLIVSKPKWSPDSRRIAFVGAAYGELIGKIYVVAEGGGPVHQITNGESGPRGDFDPTWSPDGSSLIFAGEPQTLSDSTRLYTVNIKAGAITSLPHSEGLYSPRLSPDGKTVLVLAHPSRNPVIYNLDTNQKSTLADVRAGWPTWSHDGTVAYYFAYTGAGIEPLKVRVSDRQIEHLGRLENLTPAQYSLYWIGRAPDGTIISTRDAGSHQLYALGWQGS